MGTGGTVPPSGAEAGRRRALAGNPLRQPPRRHARLGMAPALRPHAHRRRPSRGRLLLERPQAGAEDCAAGAGAGGGTRVGARSPISAQAWCRVPEVYQRAVLTKRSWLARPRSSLEIAASHRRGGCTPGCQSLRTGPAALRDSAGRAAERDRAVERDPAGRCERGGGREVGLERLDSTGSESRALLPLREKVAAKRSDEGSSDHRRLAPTKQTADIGATPHPVGVRPPPSRASKGRRATMRLLPSATFAPCPFLNKRG